MLNYFSIVDKKLVTYFSAKKKGAQIRSAWCPNQERMVPKSGARVPKSGALVPKSGARVP
jgi:hypothetical protein